ncbi:MAG: hypothetical protein JJU05_17625 [Verrucomicrobia bacterium]|nr:hypothetical protein [Verrucomicrobiota bacterium]MCH8528985.1 hypothetical protein [Kiritimatiellia bacterium]
MKKLLLLLLFFTPLFADDLDLTSEDALRIDYTQERFDSPIRTGARNPEAVAADLVSLTAIFDSLQSREREQARLHLRLQQAEDEIQRADAMANLQNVIADVRELRAQFQAIALSTDITLFESEPETTFDWQNEVAQLLQPLIAELKAATSESRELEQLSSQLQLHVRRRDTARRAIDNLDRLLEADPEPDLTERLSELRKTWQARFRDSENQVTALQSQLDQRHAERDSVLDRTRGAATTFVRTRGRNLTLGVLAFVAVYLGMGRSYLLIRKVKPAKKKGRTFSTRLFTLIWTLLGIIFGVGAMLGVFNAVGDWFLLSLTIVFLIGIGWAGMKTLPQFVEQFRMMLNMGAVKEDERIFFDGIPWRVESISFRTQLVNPLLDGGEMTLPTRMLVGLHSRPQGKREEWFPSREKDWVLLSDGTYGRVSYQTPTGVQIVLPGGSQRLIPAVDYVNLAPKVLSTGYRHEITFGVDFRHQAEAVSVIPDAMQTHLQSVLEKRLGKALQHVQVNLCEAADSALKYGILVDCGPDAGQHWIMIPRWVQTALVDLCNQKGWTIPFPQLRIHQ